MGRLKIGWAEVSITPDKKISLAGQFAERISEYVEKPLTATAFAVDSGDEQMVICSMDLGSIQYNLVEDVREELSGNDLGLDPRKVIIAAIHTHTGPVYPTARRNGQERKVVAFSSTALLKSMLPPGKKYVEKVNISSNSEIATGEEIYELLVNRTVEVILKAWKNRAEGSFTNAFGRAAVGMCRRVSYSDGSAQMWGDTDTAVFSRLESGSDTGIELLYVFDKDKKLTGIVANIACPAQCVQHRLFVSPDYWGEAKMLLRRHFGEDIFLLPLCSYAGDQCPVDLIRWVEPESDVHDPNLKRDNPPKRKADPSMFDIAGMKKAGRRVASEIINVYEDGLDAPQEDPVFIHHVRDMQLPLRRATLKELDGAKRAVSEYIRDKEGDVDFNDAAKLQVHLGIMLRFAEQDTRDTVDTEVHIIRLGTVAFTSSPFEVFIDYGNQIRARSKAEQTFLIELANGAKGYLPTEDAEKGGHYSAFISSGEVGHEGGEQLVRETLQDIRDMFGEN